ncbi:MAG: TrkH family potassium uptake protein [Oscillospiraceae bacterium]|nr:TrkH family potassium uptake protein [Oscillospiraceae bacterium]
MNFKVVLKIVGRVITMEAFVMLIPAFVAAFYGEDITPFLMSIILVLFLGVILSSMNATKEFFIREGFFTVGLIWLATGFIGALPFYYSGYFPSFIDCIFESCSGFTTTGATILTEIESLPKGILFWRSLTHWLGGMGVLVLATALIPTIGIRTKYLTQAESPGPVFSKLVPKQAQTSKILYAIYCFLTVAEAICLRIAGMPWYDSFIHAFGTAGTGGFSNMNASVGAYDSFAIDMVISIFILLFSINFAMYFLLMTRKFKEIFKSDELRFFLAIVAIATFIVTININHIYPDLKEAFRYAFFQVCSIISTTGFATADWLYWPQICQMIFILLMFCGACAGSTGGGMKCSRILVVFRVIRREIHHIIHPRAVQVVKLDGKVVEEKTIHSILTFIGAYFIIIMAGAVVVSLDGFGFSECFTVSLTCVSNIGPGLGVFGPAGNFSSLSGFSKGFLSFCMIIGRLEIFPILVLLSPSSWHRS